MAKADPKFTIQIPRALKAEVDALSDKTGTPFAQLVRRALQEYVDRTRGTPVPVIRAEDLVSFMTDPASPSRVETAGAVISALAKVLKG